VLRSTLLWIALAACAASVACSEETFARGAAREAQRVARAGDADTLLLEGGERVRLIGVNTPASVDPRRPVERFGKNAAEFTRRLAQGRLVRLEGDQVLLSQDSHGRTLVYVYLPDGRLLNLELIREGYGFAFTRYAFAKSREFRDAERDARAQGRGLWAESQRSLRLVGRPPASRPQPAARSAR
jgi:micrococcal nuclease